MNFTISEKQAEKFQDLWFECFGEEISKEKAYEEGYNLISLIQIVCLDDDMQKKEIN
jgi:hypothetical protein